MHNNAKYFAVSRRVFLLHFPDIAATKQFVEVSRTLLLDDASDLVVDHVFVAGQVVPSAQNADGSGESGAAFHV